MKHSVTVIAVVET